jgi:hypothetical protein
MVMRSRWVTACFDSSCFSKTLEEEATKFLSGKFTNEAETFHMRMSELDEEEK